MRRTRLAGAVVIGAAVLALSACFGPLGGTTVDPTGNDGPTVDAPGGGAAPDGWETLPHCPGGTDDAWVWIDGFPAEQLEAAGYRAECGDTYLDTDAPPYTSVADSSVTLEELQNIATELEAIGYELTGSTFEPAEPGDEAGLAGSWEYTLEGDEPDASSIVYVVNIWQGEEPISYLSFVDYESPVTRTLGG